MVPAQLKFLISILLPQEQFHNTRIASELKTENLNFLEILSISK